MNSWTPRQHLLKQHKDLPNFLVGQRRKKEKRKWTKKKKEKRKSSTFFANVETTNIFVAISTPKRSSRYLKPKVKKKI